MSDRACAPSRGRAKEGFVAAKRHASWTSCREEERKSHPRAYFRKTTRNSTIYDAYMHAYIHIYGGMNRKAKGVRWRTFLLRRSRCRNIF